MLAYISFRNTLSILILYVSSVQSQCCWITGAKCWLSFVLRAMIQTGTVCTGHRTSLLWKGWNLKWHSESESSASTQALIHLYTDFDFFAIPPMNRQTDKHQRAHPPRASSALQAGWNVLLNWFTACTIFLFFFFCNHSRSCKSRGVRAPLMWAICLHWAWGRVSKYFSLSPQQGCLLLSTHLCSSITCC